MAKLAVIGLVVLIFYSIYLDSQVTSRFSDARYQAPALLYSRSLELAPERNLTQDIIVAELRALDYREARYARNPGEYQRLPGQILLHRRAFDFPDAFSPPQRVRLLIDENERLERVESWPDQHEMEGLRLEPQLLGRFATDSGEDRLLVGLEQVPVLLQETLLLVEDRDFYHHHGVLPSAIARAAMANFAAGRTVQGGSTITQQLVKNMFLNHERRYTRKVNEALMALILDYRFAKDEILEAYFNEVFFGQDRGHAIHGIGLASQFYFGKAVEDLQVNEIATLVGMIRGPSLYEPRRHPERARNRRDTVLRLMFEHDLISQTQYIAAVESDVVVREQQRLVRFDRPDYVDQVQQELRALMPDRSWQRTGLRVFTAFEPDAQRALEQAARQPLTDQRIADAELAMVVTDAQTGALRALVGGRQAVNAGFNRALNARRPVGSLIKPFVYALALEQPERYWLGSVLDDEPVSLRDERGQEWQPRNFDGEFIGPVSLYQSLVDSRNIPVVQVGMEVTPAAVRSRLQRAGLSARLHAWPSLLLGAVDLTPLEVATLYGALANGGVAHRIYSVEAITTHRGDVLYARHEETEGSAAPLFEENAIFLVNHALSGAVTEGTARALGQQFHQGELAGKTGSTNDLRDSWFVSFDARQVVTVWVGHDDNRPVGLTGSRGALPLAAEYWQRVAVSPRRTELPEGFTYRYQDRQTLARVGSQCAETLRLPAHGAELEALQLGCDGQVITESESEAEQEPTRRNWLQRVFGRGGSSRDDNDKL